MQLLLYIFKIHRRRTHTIFTTRDNDIFSGRKVGHLVHLGPFYLYCVFHRKGPRCSKWKVGVIFCTVIECFTCIRHYFCSMILSTRHTDDINLPYLDHVARRPPLIRHFTTLSSQRDREMRDVYFEKR